MPVTLVSGLPLPAGGTPPGAPTQVTSIASDGAATISWLAPSSIGSGAITYYTITPYAGASAQSPTTVPVGSVTNLRVSASTFALQAAVSGLTNGTSYTFTVKASNAAGAGPESAQSGANTPQTGLLFGDEFNGNFLDPAWVALQRDSDIGNSETAYYLPSHATVSSSCLNITMTAYDGVTRGMFTPDGNWPAGPFDQTNTRSPTITHLSAMVQMRYFNFQPSGRTVKVRIGQQIPGNTWPAVWMLGMDCQQVNATSNTYNDGIGGSADNVGPDRVTLTNNPNGVGGAWGLTQNWDHPGSSEIDVGEFGGSQQFFVFGQGAQGTGGGGDYTSAVREVGIDWVGGTSIRFMESPATSPGTGAAAGTTSSTVTNGTVPNEPMFVLLNNSASATYNPGTGTYLMLVDYVRVFAF